jgi:acyl carrier protein
VPEAIDSLELAWLIHQIEQRYGVLDVDDDMLERMSTVAGVVDVLSDLKVG